MRKLLNYTTQKCSVILKIDINITEHLMISVIFHLSLECLQDSNGWKSSFLQLLKELKRLLSQHCPPGLRYQDPFASWRDQLGLETVSGWHQTSVLDFAAVRHVGSREKIYIQFIYENCWKWMFPLMIDRKTTTA